MSAKSLISLQACDNNEIVKISSEVAKMSETIQNMLDDIGEGCEEHVIPLHNINSVMLSKIVEYCDHHVNDIEKEDNKTICDWDMTFCEMPQEQLFALILAANYLSIKSLLDVTCKTVANLIKGKTPEEIRKTFNIKNDFNPSEEDQIQKENPWICEDSNICKT